MNARHRPILTVLLTAFLLASLGGFARPVTAQADTSPFTDIAGTTFEADIDWLYDEGITVGCSDTRYCPDDVVTRGQMASFLVRMFDLTDGASTDAFTDDDGTTHEGDINRLAHAGITKGCTATEFCPDRPVQRGEMATFLARAIPLTAGAGNDYFRDDDGTTHEANIDRVAAAGIASGCFPWTYCPSRDVTRGEMAAFLHRTIKPVSPPPHPAPGRPQTLYVETDGSDVSNACFVEATPCRSIRHALRVAVDGDTIAIGPGTFAEENLYVGKELTIAGDPGGGTTIDASGGGRFRIFQVSRAVTFSDLTLTGGRANHGGAISGGTLTIEDSTFRGNRVAYDGGAIAAGDLTISRTLFEANEAGASGGAIDADGWNTKTTVTGSTFRENRAGEGGAVHGSYFLTIVDSTFTANTAIRSGGAIDYWLDDDEGPRTVLITGSTFYGNRAPKGGGLHVSGIVTIANSTIAGNTVTDSGGGIHDESMSGSGRSTTVLDTTISHNEAGRRGGGMWTRDDAVVHLANTLVLANRAGIAGGNIAGPITSRLASIVGIPSGLTLADILSPAGLADNGGPTQTIALTDSARNPALGSGDAATCAAAPVSGVDQRREPRTPPCDIGAYELQK